ncbi:MAG: hypothetical protein A2283_04755 [Lentisphaerae bacterium RIFOXYA12_FULL_48_11]|nr:MAG: hypothetical protein A2283_04755 [Lentisphaerae bacterium RIFOXYA12_FULL_48_11]
MNTIKTKTLSRRQFLERSIAASVVCATASCISKPARSRPIGAAEDIRVAVIGCGSTVGNGGKGRYHIKNFTNMKGVRLVALCDPDEAHLKREVESLSKVGKKVDVYKDFRKLLERNDIDAVCIAAPNHWHSLMTIMAVQAGKNVYVEKPLSHNVWEGRKAVEAARKYDRIVQHGTQSRSEIGTREAIEYIKAGNLGKILAVHGVCYKPRNSIGKVTGPQKPPETIDMDLWTGPAPIKPLMRTNLHYDWHWFWDTGNGEIGNQGVHQMDLARWALGENCLPRRVLSIGGRFGYDDDAETPNTQIAFFDYEKAPLIFEVRGLSRQKGMTAMDYYRSTSIGFIVECEGGYFSGNNGGWFYDNKDTRIRQIKGGGSENHPKNFIDAVRSGTKKDLNADILEGHISSALCHIGNISHNLGKEKDLGIITESIKGNKAFTETFGRLQQHLAAHEVDLNKDKPMLGAWLEIDPAKEQFTGELAAKANPMLTRNYRAPFVVPDVV